MFNTFQEKVRNYYIISLSKGSIVGTFEPTGSSSLINPVSIGTTVITVDSTLGFPEEWRIVCWCWFNCWYCNIYK